MSHRRYTHAQDEEEYRELIDALNAARLQPDGTPVCTNLLTKISNSMLHTDLLNDQGDDTTLDTDLLKAVLAVMDTFAGNALIAWKGLRVLCMLQIHFAPDSDGFIEAVKGALLLHGRYNVALQDKARAMLQRWKLLYLPLRTSSASVGVQVPAPTDATGEDVPAGHAAHAPLPALGPYWLAGHAQGPYAESSSMDKQLDPLVTKNRYLPVASQLSVTVAPALDTVAHVVSEPEL